MKRLLFLLLILISLHSNYSLEEINQRIFQPIQIQTNQAELLRNLNTNLLRGESQELVKKKERKLKTDIYAPKEVTINSTLKKFYTYNNSGQTTECLEMELLNGIWKNAYRYSYTYGADGKIESYEYAYWYSTTGEWKGSFRTQYQYFDDGKMTIITCMSTLMGPWENLNRTIINRNTQGFMVDSTRYRWENGQWNAYIKVETTFSSLGMPATLLYYRYQINEWVKDKKEEYEYVNIGGLNYITNKWAYYFFNGQWHFTSRDTITFNSSGKATEIINQLPGLSNWWNYSRISNIYSGNNLIQSIFSLWEEEAWANKTRELYDYNNFNLLTQRIKEEWSAGTWKNSTKSDFLLDSYGNTVSCRNYEWKNGGFIPNNLRQNIYYNYGKDFIEFYATNIDLLYHNLTDLKDDNTILTRFDLRQNYPNPFNSNTVINYSLTETNHVILKLYNSLGEEIMTLVNEEKTPGSYNVNLDMNGFSSGVYFYKLISGEKSFTKKMILMK